MFTRTGQLTIPFGGRRSGGGRRSASGLPYGCRDVRSGILHLEDRNRLRSVLGPLAALLIITTCATSLWAAGQSVLSLWQKQRMATVQQQTLDWSMLLASRAARLAAVRESGRGPAPRAGGERIERCFPTLVVVTDDYRMAARDAGWLGLPPPVC